MHALYLKRVRPAVVELAFAGFVLHVGVVSGDDGVVVGDRRFVRHGQMTLVQDGGAPLGGRGRPEQGHEAAAVYGLLRSDVRPLGTGGRNVVGDDLVAALAGGIPAP